MNIRNYSLEQIKALIVEGSDLLVITSPASSGKNALSGQVESIRDPYWRTSLVLADANTNIESLSREIIKQALPDQFSDKLPAVSQVHQYLEYSALNGILPVIIIDDAHKLSLEVLEFILQLAALRYAESLFRIVLFADETINEHLDVPQLKNLTAGVLRNIYTTSFTKEEIKEETKEAIEDVTSAYDETDEIDEYLIDDEVVLDDAEKETSRPIIGLFILIVGLVSAYLVYSYLDDQKNIDIADSTTATQPQETISEKAVAIEEDVQEFEEEIELIDEDDLNIDEDMSENILDIETSEAEEIIVTPYEELPGYVEEEESTVVEVDEVLIPETKIDTDDENVFNLESVPEFLSNIKGPVWLRQQSANAYVLQLISAQYKSNLRNLLSGQSDIQSQLSGYVKYTPSGKPRYLLLYGIYPDRSTAEAAIKELPLKFQSIPPWPRTISDVLEELDTISAPSVDKDMADTVTIDIVEIQPEDVPAYVEEIELPVVEDEAVLMLETNGENLFNLETVPEFLNNIKGHSWLRQQPDSSYVLQLLSARYMSNIKNLLIGQSGIQDQLSGYVKYTPSGKPRYLLLYGIYPDKESAEAAINGLPVEFQSIPPWPRRLGDAIKEINTIAAPLLDDEMSEALLGLG